MTTANIHNLDLVRTAVERLTSRAHGLPGLAVLYGPAGWGKTTAALAVANEARAYFVQMRSAWTRKTLLEKVLCEMSIPASGTIPALLDMACAQLAASNRPLIIDEFDYCARSGAMIELVRDLHEGAGSAPILLLGEELLPQKLKRWERFHSRVLAWVPAQPVTLADARALVPIYCPGLDVHDDMLTHLVGLAAGSVRRVAVNLAGIADAAAAEGWRAVDRKTWGEAPLYTGEAPRRQK
jgi:DNA transposition AAA+ family ATPase